MSVTYYTRMPSPLGTLLLTASERALTGLYMEPCSSDAAGLDVREDGARLRAEVDQLEQYFSGERKDFDIELEPAGTPFQTRVWQALAGIGYGRTMTYGELAARIGMPRSARAVGSACSRNPIAIVVPCHRVVGSDGSLTGYAAGVERKRALLELERR